MDVVVIGGNGFIGSRLCTLLERRQRRFAIVDRTGSSRFRVPSKAGAVESATFPAVVPPSVAIVNLAAEHGDDAVCAERYRSVNVDGAHHVCAAANRNGTRVIVFASSVAVYGQTPVNADETVPPCPDEPYGESKLAAEEVYREWQAEEAERRTLVIVRSAPVFGEGGGGNLNRLLSRIASGRFVMIGTGRNAASLAYVDNVAAFLAFALGFAPGVHVHNYVDKPDLTMNELVARTRREAGLDGPPRWRIPYRAAHIAAVLLDVIAFLTRRRFAITARRVRRFATEARFETSAPATGFVPPVSLEDGLAATIREG